MEWVKICQFGGPWPPMHATIILEPLDIDENAKHEMYSYTGRSTNIYKNLVQMAKIQHIHSHNKSYILLMSNTF